MIKSSAGVTLMANGAFNVSKLRTIIAQKSWQAYRFTGHLASLTKSNHYRTFRFKIKICTSYIKKNKAPLQTLHNRVALFTCTFYLTRTKREHWSTFVLQLFTKCLRRWIAFFDAPGRQVPENRVRHQWSILSLTACQVKNANKMRKDCMADMHK